MLQFAPVMLVSPSWRHVVLSERTGVYCLVDDEDYEWISKFRWNIGWHARTKWKSTRSVTWAGAAHGLPASRNPDALDRLHL